MKYTATLLIGILVGVIIGFLLGTVVNVNWKGHSGGSIVEVGLPGNLSIVQENIDSIELLQIECSLAACSSVQKMLDAGVSDKLEDRIQISVNGGTVKLLPNIDGFDVYVDVLKSKSRYRIKIQGNIAKIIE